jgi:hypothetical protein
MQPRSEKRKAVRQASGIVEKAKKDMLSWVEQIGRVPSNGEMLAWQAGYISGINRLANEQKED